MSWLKSRSAGLRISKRIYKGVEVPVAITGGAKAREKRPNVHPEIDLLEKFDANPGTFLRANRQIHGYLLEQAEEIEKHGSLFSLNIFDSILKQLQKLAPELHRVHFLHYLNMLYHDDYSGALDNLHRISLLCWTT